MRKLLFIALILIVGCDDGYETIVENYMKELQRYYSENHENAQQKKTNAQTTIPLFLLTKNEKLFDSLFFDITLKNIDFEIEREEKNWCLDYVCSEWRQSNIIFDLDYHITNTKGNDVYVLSTYKVFDLSGRDYTIEKDIIFTIDKTSQKIKNILPSELNPY